ncbi:MAG: ABC transporter permease [Desulfitobacteriia bacterium]|jgi:tungstate transport system permease protein
MEIIWLGIKEAIKLIINGDPEVLGVTFLTLRVSGLATFISILIGLPIGTLLGLTNFPGRKLFLSVVNSAMGLPPVVVGLWVTIFLWRSGPLGFLNIIYTPIAIVIAQTIIASPIVTGLTAAALQQTSEKIRLQIRALGATKLQYLILLLGEIRLPLLAAVIAGFGAAVSEIGASMAVGGNIKGYSRVLTTATVLEVSKGNFDIAIALSIILAILAFSITAALTYLQQKRREG